MSFDFADLQARFGDQFHSDESLARYTVARLGGSASGVLRVKTIPDLIWAIQWIVEHQIPWRILGGGANVLISDTGFTGLVLINQTSETQIDAHSGLVQAESGANLTVLARLCMPQGIKGLEWAVSVPGTVGGAVVNNAGAHGSDTAHILYDARLLNVQSLEEENWPVADFEYAYRYSKLKANTGRWIVLSARFQLEPGHDPGELKKTADEFIAHRKKTQPPGASLGSMFKNPPGDYAGRLIEAAGLKGTQIGGVKISPVHANFFINTGSGTAADYRALIDLAQRTVYEKFGVMLELEIEQIGD